MAAPPLGNPREVGVPPNSLKSYLLGIAKFQKDNPKLSPNECANIYYERVTAGHGAVPVQGESVASDLGAVNHRTDSCPGTSRLSAPPFESQRMSRSNSTSSYLGTAPTAQQNFALLSGRSPQQFQVSTSVTCRPVYHETTLPQKVPPLEDIRSMVFEMGGGDSLALADYLNQQDNVEPFSLLRHSLSANAGSFCDDSMDKDCSFSMDGSSGIYAPHMQPQLSGSTCGSYAGGDESSHPMTRDSRSYSNASCKSRSSYLSSQAESTSPTDRFPYTQNFGIPMSRETSHTSLAHGAMMLRLSSSAGNSTSGRGGGGDYGSFCGRGDMDAMLDGVGLFASGAELSSSLDKAAGQHMLKRPSTTSVEDLDHSSAIAIEHEMQREPSTRSESAKSRKPKRVKQDVEPTAAAQGEGVSTTIATGRGMLEKEKQERQSLRMEGSGSPANCQNSATTDKTTQRESSKQMETTGNPLTGGRVLAASRLGKSGSKLPAVSATKHSYVRPPHPRVHCRLCNESPDGFRGDHELRRHMEREHARTRKMFRIKDISEDGQFLAKCKACQSGKRYGVDYNAAAHLRRQHFTSKKGGEKRKVPFSTSSPDMASLREWIEEVEVIVDDDVEYFPEQLQATDVSKADNPRESVNKESTSSDKGEEGPISQVPSLGSAAAENSPAPVAAVVQDGAVGVSDLPTQHQALFDDTTFEQPDHWCEPGSAYDLSHNYGVQYSVSGGSIPLADALNRQNNMVLPLMHLLRGRQGVQPPAGGETASTIFGNLPGPATTKDTSGIFGGNDLAMMASGSEPIFEVDDLQFS